MNLNRTTRSIGTKCYKYYVAQNCRSSVSSLAFRQQAVTVCPQEIAQTTCRHTSLVPSCCRQPSGPLRNHSVSKFSSVCNLKQSDARYVQLKYAPADFDRDSVLVFPDFITDQEAETFVNDVDSHISRKRYQRGHWDAGMYVARYGSQLGDEMSHAAKLLLYQSFLLDGVESVCYIVF